MSVSDPSKPRGLGWMALPALLFGTIAILFAIALTPGRDPQRLPSVFLGKPAPAFVFTPVDGLGNIAPPVNGFDQTALAKGGVTVVNFWASWCAPCVDEHPQLTALKGRPGVTLAGVNYKDDPAAARQFLNRYGNPFGALGADKSGRGAIEWGVYGTPETFVINGRGQIVFKHVGPISAGDLEKKILPAITAALK
jgi:cytochrome c biogenesis protein CcmG, thiol:disulfide interchange protein DsbE